MSVRIDLKMVRTLLTSYKYLEGLGITRELCLARSKSNHVLLTSHRTVSRPKNGNHVTLTGLYKILSTIFFTVPGDGMTRRNQLTNIIPLIGAGVAALVLLGVGGAALSSLSG